MSSTIDTLISENGTDRVNYSTGVMLNTEDFVAEQNYHRARLARALSYLHGYGTVSGLKVVHEPAVAATTEPEFSSTTVSVINNPIGAVPLGVRSAVKKRDSASTETEERLVVQPGLLIDRLGRMIEVSKPHCIRLNRWFESQSAESLENARHEGSINAVVADLFVRFHACERGKTPAFASGPFNSLDTVIAARLRDHFELFLVLRPKTLPLPMPVNPWQDLADVAVGNRQDNLEDTILESWQEGTTFSDQNGLVPLVEHSGVDDTTSVLLARMEIPAVAGTPTGTETPAPVRVEAPVSVDNKIRPFIYGANALAMWIDK